MTAPLRQQPVDQAAKRREQRIAQAAAVMAQSRQQFAVFCCAIAKQPSRGVFVGPDLMDDLRLKVDDYLRAKAMFDALTQEPGK